jgi:hypothetical protein
MEAIFNVVKCPRPQVLGMNEKLIEFLRTKPPTFGGSVNPLDADDWLRAILRELEPFNCEDRDKVLLATNQLTGTALAWWENYCAAAKDPSAITWDEFVEEFRRYHIPEATLKCNADEFRELHQGNKSVEEYTYQFIELARYAPEEVDKDSKKQEIFKKGLTSELRTLLTTQIYPDFNTLMNMAILTERAKEEEKKENKRKFMEHKAQQQERSQSQRSFGHPMSRFQAPMQYRTQSQATSSQGPRTQFKPYNNQKALKPPRSNTSQITANNNNNNSRVCFNCRETGHFIANCPYAKKPTTSAFSNSVNGPRPLVYRANRMPVRSNNNFGNNNNQKMRQPQQSYGRARVNHINAQEAQEAQGVVLVEFLVSSVLETILFDSGASHSFISSSFVEKHNIPTVLLKALLTRNVHLAPNTQQAEQAGFTPAKSHETCQSIFPEN